MDPTAEERYLQMALDRPDMLGSEAPMEVLEAASLVDEPTGFLENFFAAGYTQRLSKKYGRSVHLPQDRTNNAVVILWVKACRLHTNRMLGLPDEELDKPLFADELLYD